MQLLDLPGIIEGAKDGKGRGRQVIIICLVYTFILENLFRASCFFCSWKIFNLVFVIVVVTDNDEIEFYQSSILWFYFLSLSVYYLVVLFLTLPSPPPPPFSFYAFWMQISLSSLDISVSFASLYALLFGNHFIEKSFICNSGYQYC